MVVVRGVRAVMVVLSAFAASGLAACGSDPPPPPSLEAACDHSVRVERARHATCFGFVPMADEEMLIERASTWCAMQARAAGSHTDAAFLDRCAAAEDGYCGLVAECNTPYGTRAPGQPCLSYTQCSTLHCDGIRMADPNGLPNPRALRCGTCATPLPEGAACDGVTDSCQGGTPGLSCFRGVCRERGGQGADCDSWNDCAGDWICTSGNFCGAGRAEGYTCASTIDCAGALACDPATTTCEPAEYGQPGAACDTTFHWCWKGSCDIAPGATSGVCPIVLPDGSACDPEDTARTCDTYAYCIDGVCKIPDPNDCG
jgi:hypothetical protein